MLFRSSRHSSRRSIINALMVLSIVAGVAAWSIPGTAVLASRNITFTHGALADTLAIAPAARAAAPQSQLAIFLPLITQTSASGRPAIASFSANPPIVAPGGASNLVWNVSGATSLTISPGVGAVAGSSIAVHPAARTEYTLTASNAAGSARATIAVDVRAGSDPTTYFLPYRFDGKIVTAKVLQLAIDPSGGMHVIYTSNYPDASGRRPAYYGYCPANCVSADHFSVISMGDNLTYAQLALDPQGRPRVLLVSWPPDGLWYCQYGGCDTGCANPANWQLTTVTAGKPYSFLPYSENNRGLC